MAGDGAVLVTEDAQEFKAEAPKGELKELGWSRRFNGCRVCIWIFEDKRL